MKFFNKHLRLSATCILLLIATTYACASEQSLPPKPEEIPVQGDSLNSKIQIDTTLRLNFPSGVRAILEDSKGNFWFGSHQEGVCLFDGKTFRYFTKEDGLDDNQVRTIQEDREGNIWFGTGKGINSFDGKSISKRSPITLISSETNSFNDQKLNQYDLWFNADGKTGVFRYDGKNISYLAFPLDQADAPHPEHLFTCYSKGKNGKLWFGTYPAVFGYDGKSFTVITDRTLGLNDQTGRLHVRSIFEDSKGNLWIGNNGLGVLFYDGFKIVQFGESETLGANNFFKSNIETPKYRSLGRIFSIGEDRHGNIWFGTADTGAWRYDGTSLTNYQKEDGLTSLFIWDIYLDKKGELWFGLDNGHVCRFNGKSFDRVY